MFIGRVALQFPFLSPVIHSRRLEMLASNVKPTNETVELSREGRAAPAQPAAHTRCIYLVIHPQSFRVIDPLSCFLLQQHKSGNLFSL